MNYLAAQAVLETRLRSKLPENLLVRAAVDSGQMYDQSSGNPEVWVLFNRDRVLDDCGSQALIEQEWAVVYLVPGVLPDVVREGLALGQVFKALHGFDAGALGLGTFKRIGSMAPQANGKDLLAYGQLFAVTLNL
jgi:hypothetical protein